MSLASNGCEWTKEQLLSRLPAQSTVITPVDNLTPLAGEAKGDAPVAAPRPFSADVAPITRTCHASLCD